jgi:branched-chain amino acid transport system permease protein
VFKTKTKGFGLAALVLVLLVLFAAPKLANGYVIYILALMCINVLMASGFNFVIGFLGQLVFANTAFFGIGAYAYGIIMVHTGLPFPIAFLGACLAGGLAGLIVGLPALRLTGFQLAIVTLAFNELMRWVYLHSGSLGGGASGMELPDARLFGFDLDTDRSKYVLILAVTIVAIWMVRNIARSTVGRAIVSVGANELAAAALTVPPVRYKITAFALSGFFTAIAGALFALLLGRVAPESFNLNQLLLGFAMVMVGGMGTVAGPVLGAILLTAVPEFLRNIAGAEEILYSFLLIGLLLFMPSGLFGGLCTLIPSLRERHLGAAS